jgi:hypothetical protein
LGQIMTNLRKLDDWCFACHGCIWSGVGTGDLCKFVHSK